MKLPPASLALSRALVYWVAIGGLQDYASPNSTPGLARGGARAEVALGISIASGIGSLQSRPKVKAISARPPDVYQVWLRHGGRTEVAPDTSEESETRV